MKQTPYFIIDFDSTFVTVEALDELAKICLKNNKNKQKILSQVKAITNKGMQGDITFPDSLSQRLHLFAPTKEHIEKLIELLKKKITPSIAHNKDFFANNRDNIYIISGGFQDYVYPVVKDFDIMRTHVLANNFIFNKKDVVIGFDKTNPLAKEHGKARQVKELYLPGEIHIIGDGYTDWEMKRDNPNHKFYLFTENVTRKNLIDKADSVVKSFDEVLYSLKLPRATSYPKSKIKVLLLENIDQRAIDLFEQEGYAITSMPKALSEKDLCVAIKDISILGIRSKTEVTATVLSHAKKLQAIGAFCIGTNQINLQAASEKGVCVFNAPFSNTRSVVELAIGEMILLGRKAIDKSTGMHKGIWDKSSAGSHELRDKVLGIIGYGNIGVQLSVLAESLGMHVYYYNLSDRLTHGNAKKCYTLAELLTISDIITIHIDGRKENTNFIGEQAFEMMKPGVIFLNLSRGHVVDVKALAKHIKSGKIKGAGVDVFPHEPASNKEPFVSELQNLPNVLLTPHIGGSTEEAQKNIGEFVATKLIDYVNTGATTLSVNFPNLQLPPLTNVHRFIHIHKNHPGVLANITNTLAKAGINITGQYLKTNESIGYVITDVDKADNPTVLKQLQAIPKTIRVRVLY